MIWFMYVLQELNIETFGHVSDFQAVPGYGLLCTVSGIQELLNTTEKNTKNVDVVIEGKIIDHFQDGNTSDEGKLVFQLHR